MKKREFLLIGNPSTLYIFLYEPWTVNNPCQPPINKMLFFCTVGGNLPRASCKNRPGEKYRHTKTGNLIFYDPVTII